MKTTKFLLSAAIVASLFASCEADDTADISITDNSTTTTTTNNTGDGDGGTTTPPVTMQDIFGSQTEDLTLDASITYRLTGGLVMMSGTTLTIPAGTVIRAQTGNAAGNYIAIAQGAKINAVGTQANPIILTSDSNSPNAGDWGGLIILGKAPINSVAGGTATSTSEIATLPYGGNIPDDNSGMISYVRVEYSGGAASGTSENNGISFYGVGNGTMVDHIESYEGADDGVEFFGGTVNASFVYMVNNQDDSVDWTEGYSGTLTDVYIKHGAQADKGIEADGFNSDIGNNSSPLFFSNPTLNNVTIIGLGASIGEAVRLRIGTKGTFTNMDIRNFSTGFNIVGDGGASPTGQNVLDGSLKATDVKFTNVTTKFKNGTTQTFTADQFVTENDASTGTDFATWGAGWTRN